MSITVCIAWLVTPTFGGQNWSIGGSVDGMQVTLAPVSGRPAISKFQNWHVRIADPDDNPVYPARVSVTAGMPGHGHGMPTQPQVTRYLGQGIYLIEGIKFNMAGSWEFLVAIETRDGVSRITIPFNIAY